MKRFWRRPLSESARIERVRRRKERTRKGLSLLPSLLTLGNLVCGFGAIIRVALIKFDPITHNLKPESQQSLFYAGCLIFLAMIFDALDGRVARMTKSTSDFGGELDSLCDAITFGVTPGIMVVLLNPISRYPNSFWGQAAWVFGVAYACGAVLRLARFNVENTHDESSHNSFEGLPTPAAAGVIASLALLHNFLLGDRVEWLTFLGDDAPALIANWVGYLLPVVALGLAYLMMSRHSYVHFVNVYMRGRKSFDHLNSLLVVGALLALFVVYLPEVAAVLVFGGFAISGPVKTLMRGKAAKAESHESPLDFKATLHKDKPPTQAKSDDSPKAADSKKAEQKSPESSEAKAAENK
ncbi:MAG: CDP-alcohol phosphatidyltransferase family protein [Planctomycetota bacterium]|nr:CDP-alcohol phosphatidyltransferase family protein [Planctomycetota bacterium]